MTHNMSKAKIRYLKGRLMRYNWRVEQQELFIRHLKDKTPTIHEMTQAKIELLKLKGFRDEIKEALGGES